MSNDPFSSIPDPFARQQSSPDQPQPEEFIGMGWNQYKKEQNAPSETSAAPQDSLPDTADRLTEQLLNTDTEDTKLWKKLTIIFVSIGVIFIVAIAVGIGMWQLLKTKITSEPEVKNAQPAESTPANPINVQNIPINDIIISAANGGRVIYVDPEDNSTAEIFVPEGALRRDTQLRIEKVSSGDVTNVYHLLPDGLRFLKPVTVAIPYKENGLRSNQTPHDIRLEYWFTNAKMKRRLSFIVDTHDRKLRAQVSQF